MTEYHLPEIITSVLKLRLVEVPCQ